MLPRRSGSWMVIWDDRILEVLAGEGPKAPKELSERDYIHSSPSNISRRLSLMSDHNLVDPVGNGVYQITHEGRLYLVGGYNTETDQRTLDEEGEGVYGKDLVKIYVDEVKESISTFI